MFSHHRKYSMHFSHCLISNVVARFHGLVPWIRLQSILPHMLGLYLFHKLIQVSISLPNSLKIYVIRMQYKLHTNLVFFFRHLWTKSFYFSWFRGSCKATILTVKSDLKKPLGHPLTCVNEKVSFSSNSLSYWK